MDHWRETTIGFQELIAVCVKPRTDNRKRVQVTNEGLTVYLDSHRLLGDLAAQFAAHHEFDISSGTASEFVRLLTHFVKELGIDKDADVAAGDKALSIARAVIRC